MKEKFVAIIATVFNFVKSHKKEVIGAAALTGIGVIGVKKIKARKEAAAPALPETEPVQMEMDLTETTEKE